MDVFTATVQSILEDITSAALGPNADKPFNDNTIDNAMFPYNNIIGMRRRGKKGRSKKAVPMQRRSSNSSL